MKRIKLIILIGLFVVLSAVLIGPVKKSDPTLDNYVNDFIVVAKQGCPSVEKPSRFSITFSFLQYKDIGLCKVYPKRKEILIDHAFWASASEAERRQLVYHEATHCILGIHHINDASNYMNPYLADVTLEDLVVQVKKNAKDYCD